MKRSYAPSWCISPFYHYIFPVTKGLFVKLFFASCCICRAVCRSVTQKVSPYSGTRNQACILRPLLLCDCKQKIVHLLRHPDLILCPGQPITVNDRLFMSCESLFNSCCRASACGNACLKADLQSICIRRRHPLRKVDDKYAGILMEGEGPYAEQSDA